MSQRPRAVAASLPTLAKCPTGIRGRDDVTNGGFPRGRPTLICSGSGSGKTLMGMQFLVRGVEEHGEPGVFSVEACIALFRHKGFSFEETAVRR